MALLTAVAGTAQPLLAIDPALLKTWVDLVRPHAAWAVGIVGVVGFIKSLPLIAIFLPSTVLFVAIGGVYAAAGGKFAALWLAAAAGATIGDCLCYGTGRFAQRDVGKIWPLTKYPDALPRGEQVFNKYGIVSVLGAKFVWGLRPFIPVVAGVYNMPLWQFLPATTVSSMIWAGIGIMAGYSVPLMLK